MYCNSTIQSATALTSVSRMTFHTFSHSIATFSTSDWQQEGTNDTHTYTLRCCTGGGEGHRTASRTPLPPHHCVQRNIQLTAEVRNAFTMRYRPPTYGFYNRPGPGENGAKFALSNSSVDTPQPHTHQRDVIDDKHNKIGEAAATAICRHELLQ